MTVLDWDVPTPLGVFPAGLPARLLALSQFRVKVCLDPPGVHLSGRCHSIFVTTDWIREDDDADPTGDHAPLSAGLDGAGPRLEGVRWLAL